MMIGVEWREREDKVGAVEAITGTWSACPDGVLLPPSFFIQYKHPQVGKRNNTLKRRE